MHSEAVACLEKRSQPSATAPSSLLRRVPAARSNAAAAAAMVAVAMAAAAMLVVVKAAAMVVVARDEGSGDEGDGGARRTPTSARTQTAQRELECVAGWVRGTLHALLSSKRKSADANYMLAEPPHHGRPTS